MQEFLEELKNNQKINLEKGLENKIDIDYVIERLEDISCYFETSRCEVETAIDDIMNDELYNGDEQLMKQLEMLTNDDIRTIAWKVDDDDCWRDVYDSARYYVLKAIGCDDDDE